MTTSDKLKKLMTDLTDELLLEKEEEIKRLTAANEKLREENDRLKQQQQAQYKAPDQFPNRNPELTRKAADLRKAIDEFLGQEGPNRRTFSTFNPISIPNSSSDVNKSSTSTSENPKPFRPGPGDDALMNGIHNSIHNYPEPNHDFGNRQEFRQETDTDIVNAATEMRPTMPFHSQQGHNGHNGYIPGLNNMNGGRRFHNMGGVNNNNNLRRNNHNNNNNNNNNNINNNSNSNKYTIFIAWNGTVSSVDQVRELFDANDIIDIRYTAPKQFAHVDLKTENAMNKAMALNGMTKIEAQGTLRVETGKPRSSNPTENGQRQQNQTRTFTNRPNNKNINGFNNGLQKKYNPSYNNNRNNNNNNNGAQYQTFVPSAEKENGNTSDAWQTFANSSSLSSVPNQEPKPNES